MTMSTKKRKSTVLPRSTVDYLKNWMMSPDHIAHPYPTEKEKLEIMEATGIELKQLTNWFVNNRKRFWKPRVEARLQQQRQAQKPVSTANSSQSIVGPNPAYNVQQPIIAFNNRMNVMNPNPEPRLHQFKDVLPSHQQTFQIITNQHTFAPPYLMGETENVNSQVVSMGSLSYSSDSDSNSLSHVSSDCEEQVILTNVNAVMPPLSTSRSPLRKRQVILDNAMPPVPRSTDVESEMNIISPISKGDAPQTYPTLKRVRSKSDIVNSYPRDNSNIVLRPRSLTFDSRVIPEERTSTKRTCMQDWQSACQNARHGYDTSLPSLEEAATLFGYA